MLKTGITGQQGFIGTHLTNYFGLKKDELLVLPFHDDYFSDQEKLVEYVSACDVVIHLAAVNRHQDPDELYRMNIRLVEQLTDALEQGKSTPHVIFASSAQEKLDNPYGRSKLDGRIMLEKWAEKYHAAFTGLVIPNVFGPFGRPFYNSVIATFCHQLATGMKPAIETDKSLELIYAGELASEIYQIIKMKAAGLPKDITCYTVPHTSTKKVSEILQMLEHYKELYIDKGIFPSFGDHFALDLFNTFLCYIDIGKFFPVKLKLNTDQRGTFAEATKMMSGGQISFSTTLPGITRGNHFHTRKVERFTVIRGQAEIQLRKTGTEKVFRFHMDGKAPSHVDMPVWHTHNIINVGKEELLTLFYTNDFFDPQNPDTYFENV